MARTAAAPDLRDELVSIADAAREIGMGHKALYNLCYEGHVEHFAFKRPGPGRRATISIPRAEIERLKRESHRLRITEPEREQVIRAAKAPANRKTSAKSKRKT